MTAAVDGFLGPGLHPGIPHEVYHADPCSTPSLSSSIAQELVDRSAMHAWYAHPRLGGGRLGGDTPASDRGTLIHSLILGGGPNIVAVEANDWRTNKAKEEREAARTAGKLPVLAAVLADARVAAGEIEKRLADRGLHLASGKNELTAVWEDGAIWCRSRLDSWIEEQTLIVDLKTTADASPAAADKAMNAYGRCVQRAAYVAAIEALRPELAGRVQMRFAFVECEPPYGVTIAEPAGTLIDLGERKWRRAVALWRQCIATNEFPGYPREIVRVEAKPWLLIEDDNNQSLKMGNSNDTAPF